MKIKPIGKRCLIRPIEAAQISLGGIHIPGIAQEAPIKGKIIAVGNECTVKVGETVMFGKFSGQEIEFEQQKYLIMREEDIMAFLHD